jgi:glycerophosphoryl diester phosphodiesterase
MSSAQIRQIVGSMTLVASAAACPAAAQTGDSNTTGSLANAIPVVIAHRGASGYLPEHTLAAYSTAILQGADFIELDLVSTRDGHLIARHDNVLNLTTDVAERLEFQNRRSEKLVDGELIDGWFSEDFTLEEIRRLRAIERIPDVRPSNTRFDGQFGIPTLVEAIELSKSLQATREMPIGLYIEIKHPEYFRRLGLEMEISLASILHESGYSESHHGVLLQSFEIDSLRRLRALTNLRLVQLLAGSGQPQDVIAAGGFKTYEDMATAAGLQEIAGYAHGVGPEKTRYLIPRDADNRLLINEASDFVNLAHAAGLFVHVYTFRAENSFLPENYRSSAESTEFGDVAEEIFVFLALGIDGFFTDQPGIGTAVKERFLAGR